MLATDFLQDLTARTEALGAAVSHELCSLPPDAMNFKPAPGSWSVLECIEHLNRYGRYYLPALAKALSRSKLNTASNEEVGFSWLGRKSYEMVRPDNGATHKTLARMNPARSHLTREVLTEFLEQLAELQRLLRAAAGIPLNQKVVPIEFFKLLKLQLGEALLFVVAHCQRHMAQAQRARAAWEQQHASAATT
ncbi:DinB family protein [Hymenobacter tenuis]